MPAPRAGWCWAAACCWRSPSRSFAGSISLDGLLTLRVERAADDSAVARIIRLVEEAEASRVPTARFIDRFSRAYTPGVVLVAGLGLAVPSAVDTRALPGRAVSATVAGRFLTVGSPRHAREAGPLPAGVQHAVEGLEAEGRTVVILGGGAAPLGLIALRDEPRPEARATLTELRALGLRTVMLTGDNARAGRPSPGGWGWRDTRGCCPGTSSSASMSCGSRAG